LGIALLLQVTAARVADVVLPPGCLQLDELPEPVPDQGAGRNAEADEPADYYHDAAEGGRVAARGGRCSRQAAVAGRQQPLAGEASLGSKRKRQPSQKLLEADESAAVLLAGEQEPAKQARGRFGLRGAGLLPAELPPAQQARQAQWEASAPEAGGTSAQRAPAPVSALAAPVPHGAALLAALPHMMHLPQLPPAPASSTAAQLLQLQQLREQLLQKVAGGGVAAWQLGGAGGADGQVQDMLQMPGMQQLRQVPPSAGWGEQLKE
jgi:hypothetical protein